MFTASLNGADLVANGSPLPERVPYVLADALKRVARGQLRTDCPLLRIDADGGKTYVLAWRVPGQTRNGAQRLLGFVADPALLSDTFVRILKESPLLPPTLDVQPQQLLSVRVSSDEGRQVFASSTAWSQYESATTLEPELGGLRLSVALQPAAAQRLIIGGLPRNRVPLLVGLLILTTGLVIVAVFQLRRERELVRLRADFISSVSHELRTPVAQIRMFGETLLLDRVRSSDERRRSLAIIVQESQRLTQLIENVLQYSRMDHGPSRLSISPARLDVVLHEILDSFEPLARSKRTSIHRRIEHAMVVPVDAGAVRQIVLNLLDNALKYGPAGQTVTVTSRCDRGEAVIAIEDEGPGVLLTDARIWEPFYRVAGGGEATGGAGLGLAIVKQLVDLHRGRVRVERGSIGARFIVELPDASHANVELESPRPASIGA
ncbi:MAG: hypothetical protein DMF86_13235 [Acidobacteria bacterium]|nr:MAG: hypothetical protein DMF86_13235 [Acidobacteriota bacterium]